MLIRYGDQPQLSQLGLLCNTGEAGLFSNVSENMALNLREVGPVPAVICGGGASLADSLESIREMKENGAKVYALNNVAKFLVEHGIKPDAQILVDPRPDNVSFLEQPWANEVLLASQCHPSLFAKCKEIGYPVRIWHTGMAGIDKYIGEAAYRVGGGYTVGMGGMCLVNLIGHSELHLFGYDSSRSNGKSHAYPQPLNLNDELVNVIVDNQQFECSTAMAAQVDQFPALLGILANVGCKVKVYGEGALPTLWRAIEREKNLRVLTAVYDLGVLLPDYEFRSFLNAAEAVRISGKYNLIDIVFQPGPMNGFRGDVTDTDSQKQMLWQVCVGMARRHKTVRNIEVLGQRRVVQGDVFPEGWEQDKPKSHHQEVLLEKTS